MQSCSEIITYEPSMYTMDNPKVIVSNQKGKSINTLWVNTHYVDKFAHFRLYLS